MINDYTAYYFPSYRYLLGLSGSRSVGQVISYLFLIICVDKLCFFSADCFCRLVCCFLPAGRFVSCETCGFPHCPMFFLYLFQCILVLYRFLLPSSSYLTEMALFSAFCRRRCFLFVVSHETLCILLSRLSYFLFILILSSFYFLFNRWSGISAFCRSYCLLALFHMKHLALFYI